MLLDDFETELRKRFLSYKNPELVRGKLPAYEMSQPFAWYGATHAIDSLINLGEFPPIPPPHPLFWMEATPPRYYSGGEEPSNIKRAGVLVLSKRYGKGEAARATHSLIKRLFDSLEGSGATVLTYMGDMWRKLVMPSIPPIDIEDAGWVLFMHHFCCAKDANVPITYLGNQIYHLDDTGSITSNGAMHLSIPIVLTFMTDVGMDRPEVIDRLEVIAKDMQHDFPDMEETNRGVMEGMNPLWCFSLAMLNCKNAVIEVDKPSPKLQKKRKKKGKPPKNEFSIIKVARVTKKYTKSDIMDTSKMPMHLMRGHFKTYTEEAPLFGKYTGTWWWAQQIRGGKEGEVKTKRKVR